MCDHFIYMIHIRRYTAADYPILYMVHIRRYTAADYPILYT